MFTFKPYHWAVLVLAALLIAHWVVRRLMERHVMRSEVRYRGR